VKREHSVTVLGLLHAILVTWAIISLTKRSLNVFLVHQVQLLMVTDTSNVMLVNQVFTSLLKLRVHVFHALRASTSTKKEEANANHVLRDNTKTKSARHCAKIALSGTSLKSQHAPIVTTVNPVLPPLLKEVQNVQTVKLVTFLPKEMSVKHAPPEHFQ
jgi:hypothetical protein